jgi:predicted SprT family Zn-dependent metalloprotease
MKRDEILRYYTSLCPRCDVQEPATDVSVNEDLQTTFYYKCKCGLEWTKIRRVELTLEEIKSIIALTKKLHPELWAKRRSY